MLKIHKNGIIKGGSCLLTYDPQSEKFSWKGHVKIGVGPVIKKVEFDESYNIPAEFFESESLYVGKKVEKSGTKFEVLSKHSTYAIISFDSEDIDGIITVSTLDKYIEVIELKASGKYSGYNLKIEATKE